MNHYILDIKINIESRDIKIMGKFDLAIKTLWGQRIFKSLLNLQKYISGKPCYKLKPKT